VASALDYRSNLGHSTQEVVHHDTRAIQGRMHCMTAERKKPLGKTRRRWADNITLHLHEIGSEGVEWLYLAQDTVLWRAVVNTVMNLQDS
jgi:hypothetical protein